MPDSLTKLRPDRDLQCYFERPSAIAALSETSTTGFTLSGNWRQQFDWAVVEWNRDNVFEHPAFRNLPDGDLSGLQLSYEEWRTGCIPLDSTLYPTVDWPYLRIWAESAGAETLYKVRLRDYAAPIEGTYEPATAVFELQGTPSAGDYIELAWADKHYYHQLTSADTVSTAAASLATVITEWSGTGLVSAAADGSKITLTYLGGPGENGNRIGVYGTVSGQKTVSWSPAAAVFSGGKSPSAWRVDLDFGNLLDVNGAAVPTFNVRKMRWTWAADLQAGSYRRNEFKVVVANWLVTGTNLTYRVAGPGSRRLEDDSPDIRYIGPWTEARGNFSGGSIRYATMTGAAVECAYEIAADHALYLGSRRAEGCGTVSIQVDDDTPMVVDLHLAGEDTLVRVPLGERAGGAPHSITVTHAGASGCGFYFDFFEIAIPTEALPKFAATPRTALATDWDTDHSLALAPERTAWMISALGFAGRANHYAGALWFYDLKRDGHSYASATVSFTGTPEWSKVTTVTLNGLEIAHVTLMGDTDESIATCLALLINAGATAVWARVESGTLTVTARTMGTAGNGITIAASTSSEQFTATTSGTTLSGGVDGAWRTDLEASPRLNRAARDWSRSFFRALSGYGMEATAAFSMELQHGDPGVSAGIAQRYPNGDPVLLNTPALQTNFGPASTAFWKQVYLEMASVMVEAGMNPYLQFGEVQWWYFAAASGMPFYDDYSKERFQAAFGRAMAEIPSESAEPANYPDECTFLPGLIGEFTDAVTLFVRQSHPSTRFEALYAPDVNDTPLVRSHRSEPNSGLLSC
jgi:hypothetical protein